MVKSSTTKIVFIKDHKINSKQEFKKGQEITVYESLRKELVDVQKVAKLVKGVK